MACGYLTLLILLLNHNIKFLVSIIMVNKKIILNRLQTKLNILISATSQCAGIPLSFLSLSLASVKLYYSQRLGNFAAVDPSLKMIAFAFPFVSVQILGPLFSLIFLAAYFRGFVLLFIAFIIFTNFVTLKYFHFKGKPYVNIPLYENYYTSIEESNFIFITATLTSWISSSTVWSNNFIQIKRVLLISSLSNTLAHTLSTLCIYIYIYFDDISVMISAPITHCFTIAQNLSTDIGNVAFQNLSTDIGNVVGFSEESYFDAIKVCNSNDACLPIQRLCSDGENPTDQFYFVIGPVGLLLLGISFTSSLCLQTLGNYYTMFRWSKYLFCCQCRLNA